MTLLNICMLTLALLGAWVAVLSFRAGDWVRGVINLGIVAALLLMVGFNLWVAYPSLTMVRCRPGMTLWPGQSCYQVIELHGHGHGDQDPI
jgi:hypothetical protein